MADLKCCCRGMCFLMHYEGYGKICGVCGYVNPVKTVFQNSLWGIVGARCVALFTAFLGIRGKPAEQVFIGAGSHLISDPHGGRSCYCRA